MGNCDPYSDSSEPAVVDKLQSTRSEEPTLLCNQVPFTGRKRGSRRSEREQRSVRPPFLQLDFSGPIIGSTTPICPQTGQVATSVVSRK
jgi:hypothetical protein